MSTINPIVTSATAATTGTTSTTSSTSSGTSVNPSASLNESDFLQLLVTQMTNQDPMQPMSDTQFTAEMAQFSSLEQMENLNTSSQLNSATNMIGDTVTWANSSGQSVSSVVGSVSMSNNTPSLVMQSSEVPISSLTSGLNATNPSLMVGTTVSWKDTLGNTQSGTVSSIDTKTSAVVIAGESIGLGQVLSITKASA